MAKPDRCLRGWHTACTLFCGCEEIPRVEVFEKSQLKIDRRTPLKAGAASVVASGSMAGLARAAGVTIGIVYVGPRDDFGWNQAHAVAAKALKSIPGVYVVEEENVPET